MFYLILKLGANVVSSICFDADHNFFSNSWDSQCCNSPGNLKNKNEIFLVKV